MSKDGPSRANQAIRFIRVSTRQLKLIVEQHRKSRSEEAFLNFVEGIQKGFDHYYKKLGDFEPGMDRAMVAHRLVNQAIEESSDREPTCTKGCSACCHFEVDITSDEAMLLAGLVGEGVEVDRLRLAEQAKRKRGSPEWSKPFQKSNQCVFLGADQACRIYDFRPMSCRKHRVSSPPSDCAKGSDQPILLALAELAVSAALSQPGNLTQSLAKALLPLLPEVKPAEKPVEKPEGTSTEVKI
jgi:Fe-S-cluster containining protein